MAVRGYSVEELLRKADPVTDPKLAVIRDYHSSEDEDTNWATDQVIRGIRQSIPDLQVAEAIVSLFDIKPNVSNDPESDNFVPGDQFPLVFEKIDNADVVIFSCQESAGFPSSKMVLLMQRMCALAKERNESREEKELLLTDHKVAGIVINGGYGVVPAALSLAGTISKFGFTLVRHGFAVWDHTLGDIKKNKEFGECLDRLSSDIVDLCKAVHR